MPLLKPEAGKKKSLVRERRLTSALCMLLIGVLLIAFITLFWNVRAVVGQTEQLLKLQTTAHADEVAAQLSGYSRMCEVLASSERLLSFAEYDGTEDDETLTRDSFALRKEMTALCALYGADVNMLGAYFIKSGSVVTMARWLEEDKNDLFFRYYTGLSPEILRSMSSADRWSIHYGDSVDAHTWVIYRVQKPGQTLCYIIADINLDNYISHTATDGTLILIGDETQCCYSNMLAPTGPKDYAQLYKKVKNAEPIEIGGVQYLAALSPTRLNGHEVIAGVPTTDLRQIETTFALVILATCVLVLVCIVVLVASLSRRLFTPVEYLIDSAHHEGGDATQALHCIAEDLVATKQANEQMLRERDSIVPLALGRQLGHLIAAPAGDQSLTYAQSCLMLAGIQPGGGYAVFAVSCVEDRRNFFDTMGSDPRMRSQEGLFQYLLNNVLTDLLFSEHPGTVAPFHENWFLVVTACDSAIEAEQIEAVVSQLLHFYESSLSAVLVSTDVLRGVTPANFIASVLALSQDIAYLSFWGSDKAENAEEDAPTSAGFSYYCRMIRKLINNIDTQDYQDISGMIDVILDRAIPSGVENLQIAKYRIYTLVALLITSLDEQFGSDRRLAEAVNFEERLYSIDNIADFKRELHSILSELVENQKQQGEGSTTASRMDEIKQYIQAHHTENELTASAVAQHFQMSSSYLSRAFKEYTGINILEYIQRLRVDAAKKLLAEGSVKTVAQKVGFWDTQGLVRTFKKYEGISPSEYKKLLEKEQHAATAETKENDI